KSAAAAMARRVGRDEVRAASTVIILPPNLKAGLTVGSSPVKTSRSYERTQSTPMLLVADLGKTSCRAVVHGKMVVVPGAPGLATPGGARAAERAVLVAADALGLDGVDEVVVGAAGALAAPEAARELGEALLRSLPAARAAVTSDAVLAHAGALGGEPGVVLIAGTGVVALAIGADGALRTADGWGPGLGDEGGGAWIGASGLRAALRAHDGRGPSTA